MDETNRRRFISQRAAAAAAAAGSTARSTSARHAINMVAQTAVGSSSRVIFIAAPFDDERHRRAFVEFSQNVSKKTPFTAIEFSIITRCGRRSVRKTIYLYFFFVTQFHRFLSFFFFLIPIS